MAQQHKDILVEAINKLQSNATMELTFQTPEDAHSFYVGLTRELKKMSLKDIEASAIEFTRSQHIIHVTKTLPVTPTITWLTKEES